MLGSIAAYQSMGLIDMIRIGDGSKQLLPSDNKCFFCFIRNMDVVPIGKERQHRMADTRRTDSKHV